MRGICTMLVPAKWSVPVFREWLAYCNRVCEQARFGEDRNAAMRLLIVEDNVELSRLLASGLMAAGYESDIVNSVA
ncbi:hypothetical protein ACEV9E_25935, partial [Vibrio parahaemolyticus]